MNRCDEAFYERFEGVTFENDIPLVVWREAWDACLEMIANHIRGSVVNLNKEEVYED